tara:strand:- start:65 stop:268 length:204 start_codon:yes stop_codon:yes gene_type:complete
MASELQSNGVSNAAKTLKLFSIFANRFISSPTTHHLSQLTLTKTNKVGRVFCKKMSSANGLKQLQTG